MRTVKRARFRRMRRERPGKSARVGWLRWMTVAYLIVVLLVWALIRFGGDVWSAPTVLLFGPRWVLGLPLLWLLPFGAMSDRWILPPLLLTAVVIAWPIMGFTLAFKTSARIERRDLRLLTYNVGSENNGQKPELNDIWRLINIARPDVVALQECDFTADQLAAMFPAYHANVKFDTCFLSRFAILTIDTRNRDDFDAIGGSGIIDRFEIATPRGIVSVLNLHLETVRKGLEKVVARADDARSAMRYSIAERRAESRLAREWARRAKVPQLVAGDFNLPADSAIFRAYWGDLADAHNRCGTGYGFTKYTKWFGMRIDHVLFDSNWECLDETVDYSLDQGDHRPVIVDLRLR